MKVRLFNRAEHIYKNEAFEEIIKDAVRFFNGTPVLALPISEKFSGTGVYALYCTGKKAHYNKFSELNRLAYNYPIYIGKAVPEGWRQSRVSCAANLGSAKLYYRLLDHVKSIKSVDNLSIEDFSCRFMILEGVSSDMIGTVEAALIKLNKPLWNSVVDGFGNHDPGSGRYEQAKSDWDVIHHGRKWAVKCMGKPRTSKMILKDIGKYFNNLIKK
jgi:hypothetical protein